MLFYPKGERTFTVLNLQKLNHIIPTNYQALKAEYFLMLVKQLQRNEVLAC